MNSRKFSASARRLVEVLGEMPIESRPEILGAAFVMSVLDTADPTRYIMARTALLHELFYGGRPSP